MARVSEARDAFVAARLRAGWWTLHQLARQARCSEQSMSRMLERINAHRQRVLKRKIPGSKAREYTSSVPEAFNVTKAEP